MSSELIEREFFGVEAGSERAERLASLLTLSYEPMLVWDLNGPIEFWNTGAERLYGFTPGRQLGALATYFFKRNSRSHLTS